MSREGHPVNQPMSPQPLQPAPRKKRTLMWVLIAILGIIAVSIAGCIAALGGAAKNVADAQKAEHTIVYKVTANGKAKVTYGASSGSSSEEINADWSKTVKVTGWEAVSLVVVSGDFLNEALKVTCEVTVDGKSQAKNEASGASAMATCSADTLK